VFFGRSWFTLSNRNPSVWGHQNRLAITVLEYRGRLDRDRLVIALVSASTAVTRPSD
jgi:hypothetical protein